MNSAYISDVLRFIPPCSPIRAKTVPAGDAWLHEPKLDGYRVAKLPKRQLLLRRYVVEI